MTWTARPRNLNSDWSDMAHLKKDPDNTSYIRHSQRDLPQAQRGSSPLTLQFQPTLLMYDLTYAYAPISDHSN